jgi:hypothetical protein
MKVDLPDSPSRSESYGPRRQTPRLVEQLRRARRWVYVLFEVDAWGDEVGSGVSHARYCTLGAIAKFDSQDSEFAVANEFICGRLGLLVGLPIPPGVVIQTEDGRRAYLALRFGKKGERPPPAIPQQLVEDNPAVAGAVVAFDCWIANSDRHANNLAYSREGAIPPAVFDHERALLGAKRSEVQERMVRLCSEPVVMGCLPPLIRDGSYVLECARRIVRLPSEVIVDTCREAERLAGLDHGTARLAQDVLETRRVSLTSVLQASLTLVETWGLLLS